MRYIILILSGMIGLILSCKKSELQKYTAGDGIYFYSIDSVNYSFANQVGNIDRDTILVAMRILGEVKDYDRPLQLKAVTGTTAQANTHYILPVVAIKANTNTIAYPVIVLNTPDLKTNTVRLELQVSENTDFAQGAGIISNGTNFNIFKINFNNRLIKPSYWSSIQGYFGEYSDVKYKFMIDTLGFSDFSSATITFSEYYALKATMTTALQKYVATNGPLVDESGKTVSFPI